MGYQKIDHRFAFPELEYESEENYQPCIELSFFFKKLLHVSYEHFHKHYAHVHADLTVAAKDFNVCKIERYVQCHQTPEMKEKIRSLDWYDWERFFTSAEYAKALMPDADHFMDVTGEGIKVMARHDLIVFGKAIPDVDGKDGITRT